MRYAKENSIPVGPGSRFSRWLAGRLLSRELLTSIRCSMTCMFERFLNPGRVSLPDIDIDFCVRGRGEVINHVADLYGRDSVCQIITFGTLGLEARQLRMLGRALEVPYSEVDRIAKMIPPPVRGRNVSITQALEQVPELKNGELRRIRRSKRLIEIAQAARRLCAPFVRPRCRRRNLPAAAPGTHTHCRLRQRKNSPLNMSCPISRRQACLRWTS